MAKLGKKYRLFSDGAIKTANLYKAIKNEEKNNVVIKGFVENYNNKTKQYEGSITITGAAIGLDNLMRSADFVSGTNSTIINTIFEIDNHYEELAELPKTPEANSLNVYKFKSALEYNFLVKNYETYLQKNNNISETALPYFYDVLTDFVQKDNYRGFVGTSFFETPQAVIQSTFRNQLIRNIIPYSVTVDDQKLRIDKYLDKFNAFKEQFPFYADISFDTHELDEKSIIAALEERDLSSGLFEQVAKGQATDLLYITPNTVAQNVINASLAVGNNINFQRAIASQQNTQQTVTIKKYNIESYLSKQFDTFVEKDFTFIFDINQRIDGKARTFMEVLQSQKEYSEYIGYRLSKYLGNTNTLIQEWYLPNIGEGKFNWVDSQIKYDKLYTYKLEPIVLTFGTRYQFTRIFRANRNQLILEFKNKPLLSVYVIENVAQPSINLGTVYTNRLLDYPPTEPEVELIPYIGVANSIKINLNTSTGLKTVPAINFDPSEDLLKDKLRLAQNKDTSKDLLTFQADEPSEFFEIYRIDQKPKSYNDFFGHLIAKINTDNASSAAYLDNINPNKKYYYTVRSIDFHGNISNPTPVYELEIIEDNGLVIPIINVVEFDKGEENKELSKAFKKYLKIQPAVRHRIVNIEKTDKNNVELGIDKIVPWTKNFVLRLTSKSTGKKMDVKFTFKYNKPQ